MNYGTWCHHYKVKIQMDLKDNHVLPDNKTLLHDRKH